MGESFKGWLVYNDSSEAKARGVNNTYRYGSQGSEGGDTTQQKSNGEEFNGLTVAAIGNGVLKMLGASDQIALEGFEPVYGAGSFLYLDPKGKAA